jgi:hypothetical protein
MIIGGYWRIFLLSIIPGCGGCAELTLRLLCYPPQNSFHVSGCLFAVIVSDFYSGVPY